MSASFNFDTHGARLLEVQRQLSAVGSTFVTLEDHLLGGPEAARSLATVIAAAVDRSADALTVVMDELDPTAPTLVALGTGNVASGEGRPATDGARSDPRGHVVHEALPGLIEGPMPRDMVYEVNSQFLDVLTLLIAARGQVDETNGPAADDYDPLTSPSSRAVTLIGMAEDKVRAMLHTISPYV